MDTDTKMLKVISNETKESIENLDVVTPSIYTTLFSKFATSHDVNFENEIELTNDLLKEQIGLYTNLQNSTSQNAQKLSEHTDKAIGAIKDKNETLLYEVLKETQHLRHEIEKLKESVYKDELTHVYNRKWLHDTLLDDNDDTFIKDGTLTIIDLNYFKIINDTYGHIVGDKVLIFIANQLRKSGGDVIRYGGDEFVIIFPKTVSKKDAQSLLNKIREELLTKQLKVKETSFKMSFSIGASSFSQGDTLADVIDNADKEMYEDKIQIKKRITGI